jgi:hypothetical protein
MSPEQFYKASCLFPEIYWPSGVPIVTYEHMDDVLEFMCLYVLDYGQLDQSIQIKTTIGSDKVHPYVFRTRKAFNKHEFLEPAFIRMNKALSASLMYSTMEFNQLILKLYQPKSIEDADYLSTSKYRLAKLIQERDRNLYDTLVDRYLFS